MKNALFFVGLCAVIVGVGYSAPVYGQSLSQPNSAIDTAYMGTPARLQTEVEADNNVVLEAPVVVARPVSFSAPSGEKVAEPSAVAVPGSGGVEPPSEPNVYESTALNYESEPSPAAGWHLPQPCFFQQHGIKLGGWVQQGITFPDRFSADRFNGPIATNDRSDEYMLNQAWLYLDKPYWTTAVAVGIGAVASI